VKEIALNKYSSFIPKEQARLTAAERRRFKEAVAFLLKDEPEDKRRKCIALAMAMLDYDVQLDKYLERKPGKRKFKPFSSVLPQAF
jgi:hypothetical protein